MDRLDAIGWAGQLLGGGRARSDRKLVRDADAVDSFGGMTRIPSNRVAALPACARIFQSALHLRVVLAVGRRPVASGSRLDESVNAVM